MTPESYGGFPAFRGVRALVLVGACLLPGASLLLLSGPAAVRYALLASTALALAGGLTAATAAARTAGRTRGGWALLSVACAGWGLGNGYWSWNELVVHADVLFPSPADVGFLVFPTAGAVGLWLLSGRSSLGSRITALLDGLIVTGSLLTVSWVTTLRTVYEAGADSRFGFVVSLAYPLGDLVLVTMVFLLATRTRRGNRGVVVLLITGLLGMAVADTLFAVATANGSYVSGSPSDAGWIVGFTALALAGWETARRPMSLETVGFMRRWQLLLPYAPFGAALAISGVQVASGRLPDAVHSVTLLSVFALIMVRQLLTLLHNSSLAEQLRHRTFHDPLTGLANRALFADRLEHALALRERGGSELAVMYLDLDDFKLVNDTFGHDAGDRVLCGVAQRLRDSSRVSDTVARLGGDEFAVLLEHSAHPEVHAQRVLDNLRLPFTIGARSLTVAASIGIASTSAAETRPGLRHDDLLKQVDLALYAAKARGKNTYALFESLMRDNFDEEMTLRADLTRAVRSQELRVVYQPIVELADRRMVGVEALARWHHPTLGEVPPAVFIPVAERAGLIAGIGSFVLTRACEQFVRCNGTQDRYLTVNVSPLQLLDLDFPRVVSDALARSGLRPDQLVLEITENVLAEESDVVEALHGLRHLGVRVAMDDFGTGYSSLRHLHRFPIDIIKIDRSYIRDIGSDQGAARIVNTLLHLFSALGLTTVAEGIEDADQAALLQRLGCRYGQGYLFSRPVEAHLLPATLAAAQESGAAAADLLSGARS